MPQKGMVFYSPDFVIRLTSELSYIDIYNIRPLSVNIKFICASFRNKQKSEPSASFTGLFRSEYK